MMATRVLVVDDELGMRETLVDILEGAGYEVAAAADGTAALAEVQGHDFDIVLMDIRMPGPDGVTVLQQMGPPPPRVIMMTAYAVEDQLRRAMDAQAFAVVQKPFQVRYLLNLVEGAAETPS
ncbi:MAG TPA: response regulator [Acidimicrobiales bacterium]|nr:response regulator [Acidimicrobiales bacterium]